MNDSTDLHACNLELEGGYHGHPYPQKFVRADKSQYPGKPPAHPGKEVPANHEAISILTRR
jgi:hypothetical protein